MSEWRQFRMLMRISLGRLMDTAVASRGIDATQFAIWTFALVATPLFIFAGKMVNIYSFMWRRPDMVERMVLSHRLFFIVYTMLAAAFLAAMLWDALFPDRQDQEVVGVLPVRPRTLAAARLATALGVVTTFSVGLAVSSGFVYMTTVAAGYRSAAIVGFAPVVFLAHVVTLTLAGVCTFAALLALRAMAVACVGAEAAQRVAALLQLVTLVLLIEGLIFLPGILNSLGKDLLEGHNVWLPPLWFMSLYASMGGPPVARVPGFATMAIIATLLAVAAAVAAYLLPATWNARRALEAKLKTRAGRWVRVARQFASPALRTPAARAVFVFTLASLARNRRSALTLATYAAAGIALAAVRFTSAHVRDVGIPLDAPADYLLSLPLVITFFLVAALRSAFSVPTDIQGNWTFRMAQPRSTAACVHAVGVAFVCIAVLPVSLGWLFVTAALWDLSQAAAAAAMHAASGIAFVELTLIGCRSIPFTRAHAAAVDTVKLGWVYGLFALILFAFRLDDLQLAALRSTRGVAFYLLAMALVVAAARAYRRTRRRAGALEFDAPQEEAPAVLNLSQATG